MEDQTQKDPFMVAIPFLLIKTDQILLIHQKGFKEVPEVDLRNRVMVK
jgi:hypothetical protein